MNRHARSHRKVIAIGLTGLVLGLMPPAGAPPAVADERRLPAVGWRIAREARTQSGRKSEDTERPRGEDPAAPQGD